MGRKLGSEGIRNAVFVIILLILAALVMPLKSPDIGHAQPFGASSAGPSPAPGPPGAVAAFLPQTLTNIVFGVAREAHYHEAILAALAMFTWHLFNVHFKPGKFPGSMVW